MLNRNSLKDIELYFSEEIDLDNNTIIIKGDELKHLTTVMRHKPGDKIFVTDGKGSLFETVFEKAAKEKLETAIITTTCFKNNYQNVFFCIPLLRNPERFEFALEKSVELGITNFIIYTAKRSVKKNVKAERLNKIVLSAMKQSLRTFLPSIIHLENLAAIVKNDGEFFVLHQGAEKKLKDVRINREKNSYFLFGPEGGFDISELEFFSNNDFYKLSVNRLRSETAVISTASLLCTI